MGLSDHDDQGLYIPNRLALSTWTHKWIDPLDPDPSQICIEDIAHSLARICRYNGHVYGHLSVARHSLWVSDRLAAMDYSVDSVLWGLLHDAAEAYVGDMVRPLKHREEMKMYALAEGRMVLAIAKVFGLDPVQPDEVTEADRWVLTEIELPHRRWTWNTSSALDEADFLSRFHRLKGLQ